MTRSARFLSVIWLTAGASLAVLGFLALIEEPFRKYGRVWTLTLLPTVTFAAAWGAIALGMALLQTDGARVALLGRVMSVPLFMCAIALIVLAGVSLLLGVWTVETLVLSLGGISAFSFSAFNYRIAKQADKWE